MSHAERVYLRPGESPPRGVPVYFGPRGGRYYLASGSRASRRVARWDLPPETETSRLLARLEAARVAAAETRRDLAAASRRGEDASRLRVSLESLEDSIRGLEAELGSRVASGEIDWLDRALSVRASRDDILSVEPIGGEDVSYGLHAVNTHIVGVRESFWTPHPAMHPSRAVYKCGDSVGLFQESQNEMAAWAISEILELGICPEVRYAGPISGDRWGHVMRWLDHAGERDAEAVIAMRYPPARRYSLPSGRIRRDVIRIYVLDVIGNNGDRHFGNWIVHRRLGRAFAIDNGFMFNNVYVPEDLSSMLPTRILGMLGEYSPDDHAEFARVTSRLAERRDAVVAAVRRIYSQPDSRRRSPTEIARRLESIERGLHARIDMLIQAGGRLPNNEPWR